MAIVEINKHPSCIAQAAAEALEKVDKSRAVAATDLRLVECLASLTRVLVESGQSKLTQKVVTLQEEIESIRTQLKAALGTEVVSAAMELQEVLEFHEARKTRASKSAKLREHELRHHMALFGQDTPTETQRLQSCVKELKQVVAHSQTAIEKAMQRQQSFWARYDIWLHQM